MTDHEKEKEKMDYSKYKYSEMSNKVQRQDRRGDGRAGDNEDVVEPESLAGKVSKNDMGNRVKRVKVSEDEKKKFDDKSSKSLTKLSYAETLKPIGTNTTLLEAGTDILKYRPTTVETQRIFNLIFSWTQSILGDVADDIVSSASDTLLEISKSDIPAEQKRTSSESLLESSLSDKVYSNLVNLCQQINDYVSPGDQISENQSDERLGVAVDPISDDDDEGSFEGLSDDDESIEENLSEEENEEIGFDDVIDDTIMKKEEDEDDKLVPAYEIDTFWLQRKISEVYNDSHVIQEKTTQTFEALQNLGEANYQLENKLFEIFEYNHNELIALLVKNQEKIVWLTLLAKAESTQERDSIRNDIKKAGLNWILLELHGSAEQQNDSTKKEEEFDSSMELEWSAVKGAHIPRTVSLEALEFDQGNHLKTSPDVQLPKGSSKSTKNKKYEEIHVPPPTSPKGSNSEPLVPISDLPHWAQKAFGTEIKSLNRIQSKLYPTAFKDDQNILLCAPTGGGKTNVALLSMLRTISLYMNDSKVDLDAFKIIYIAPLKALVQEQVNSFSKRLNPFGIKVAELTGDSQLTKQQISETQVIVTTPEKWDVITRKSSDISYTNLVRLIIIDEIHLLHDERGPVLESIVARTLRKTEATGDPVRLVGLSATLPNYKDVAQFLRVDLKTGLFYFDATYRPCPLSQQYIGVTDKSSIEQYRSMNDACYEKVMENAGNNQVIIFVHSRKETVKTARYLRDTAIENGTLNRFLGKDSSAHEVLKTESEKIKDNGLRDLYPTGFAVHHAGLSRSDRGTVEEAFKEGFIQVLVSTATLAWGVNLPAHTVIIRGTQVYSPEKGRWAELSPQDVIQMLGRAGRPGYDTSGEGIIITTRKELQFYMSLINTQLPIESQFISKLPDHLNAEIVLGTISTLEEAIKWLGYTYLFVRMLKSPDVYKVGAEYANDKDLLQKRLDLVHSALLLLEKAKLVKYDKTSGVIYSTELGKISSHYYISHFSMDMYNKHLKPYFSPIEIFRLFAMSGEFKYIPVRGGEKAELTKLLERVPIPIREGIDDPTAKINILLQAYISRLKLDTFVLMSDMVYVTQSAGRLLRAIYEICLRKGWAQLSKLILDLSKMVAKRIWLTNSPFTQFPDCPRDIIRHQESSQLPWSQYLELKDTAEVTELLRLRNVSLGQRAFNMLRQFPRLSLDVRFRPMTPSLLKFELAITPEFEWNESVHGLAEPFYIFVEDCDSEQLLYNDYFIVRKKYIGTEHYIDFTVKLLEPIQPNYFVTIISERWLHCETRMAVPLIQLVVPKKFPEHTPLLDQLIPTNDLGIQEFSNIFPFKTFNRVQSQAYTSLYGTDDDVFVGIPKGSGKTACAELSILRHWKLERGRVVYIAPFQEQIDDRLKDWRKRLSQLSGGKEINKLTGELASDRKLLAQSHLILATPTQWDYLSRKWLQRKNVQEVELFIADDVQMVGGQNGSIYEVIISRMKFISVQIEKKIRMIALSTSLSNGRDFGEWIGANKRNIFNFSPEARQKPLKIRLSALSVIHHPSLLIAMAKPTFSALKQESQHCVVFVDTRKQCVETSSELFKLAQAEDNEDLFIHTDQKSLAPYLNKIHDLTLKQSVTRGIGFLYSNMNKNDRTIVTRLYEIGAIQVLLATMDTCWYCPKGNLVVVMGTQFFEGKEHRYIDYSLIDLLEMIGCAPRDDTENGQVLILTNNTKRDYYLKFLKEALPIESHLNVYLHDSIIPEICNQIIKNEQGCVTWLTYTYFLRRLKANPSFYGLLKVNQLNEYLSDLVEDTLKELSEAKLVELYEDGINEEEEEEEEDDNGPTTIVPTPGAEISAHHNISYVTMQTFLLSLTGKSKLKSILEIVSSAAEFEILPIRTHEESVLAKIYDYVPVKISEAVYSSPSFKAFVLLQAHFSRLSLPPDLASDQNIILEKILGLLAAVVDVLSGEGHLNAMNAMDLSQMVVQAVWNRDSPLKQIPHFSSDVIDRCTKAGVEGIDDIINLEDDERDVILKMDNKQVNAVAEFVNKYPFISVSYDILEEKIEAGSIVSVAVKLDRDQDPDLIVSAPFFPFPKTEQWWILISESSTKQILAIKRIAISKKSQITKLQFEAPNAGQHDLKITVMCDSYVDADRETSLDITVLDSNEDDDVEMES